MRFICVVQVIIRHALSTVNRTTKFSEVDEVAMLMIVMSHNIIMLGRR